MFLKSLTLKGFKSFADRATLEFEPGVAVVVGPNGSGKSNLVDAVAWVLGAQGARSMRGAKMDDVIFAGTPKRAALGRAEVSLTIDNSAGLLPIEFSEVTITRSLFRSGESEYQINGTTCRLLDIQELLSDTGVGRQQHVIVGQGQLDRVLNARPDERRAIIEEAAGILKYRRRKEKAERRLEATEASVLRLQDLLREVRRQLKPLERQADAARRHDDVARERRALRLYLCGRELAALQERLSTSEHRRAPLAERERAARERLRELDARVLEVERRLTSAGSDDLGDALVRAESLRERARGLAGLLAERRRQLARRSTDVPSQLSLEIDAMASEEVLAGALAAARGERERAERAFEDARDALRDTEAEVKRWQVRREALALAIEADRAAAPAGLTDLPGALGLLADLTIVDAGYEMAVAAALGDATRAFVIAGEGSGRRALELVDGEPATLLVSGVAGDVVEVPPLPPGCARLRESVRGRSSEVDRLLDALLGEAVVVAEGWRAAVDVALAHPQVTVVTRAGDRFRSGRLWMTGGATAGATLAALDEAEVRLAQAEAALVGVRQAEAERAAACALARELEDERRQALDATLAQRGVRYGLLARLVDDKLAEVDRLADSLRARRSAHAEATRAAAAGLDEIRLERARHERLLQEALDEARSADLGETEARMRIEAQVELIRAEFDREPQVALDAEAPELPPGTTYEERLRELDRDLRMMGTVNPLAVQEYEALEERHTFLDSQLDDVRKARRELLKVVQTVDEEIAVLFSAAYQDVEEHFAALVGTLFPGGSGRLRLTEPGDSLGSGVDVEARPSGKSPRRLSLLSGGERSLVALAFLFAVFRSRPSPFYLLDEVEAALDDVNLHRFLDLVEEFRGDAQLLIVTHQKRTMEAADCLYGVSMPPGGSSVVVAQRLQGSANALLPA